MSRRGGGCRVPWPVCLLCGYLPGLALEGPRRRPDAFGVRGPPPPPIGVGGPRTPVGRGGGGAGISANRDRTGTASRHAANSGCLGTLTCGADVPPPPFPVGQPTVTSPEI